jgi:hypothetical protein
MLPAEVRAFAEDTKTEETLWPTAELVRRDGYSVWFGPRFYPRLAVVYAVRSRDVRQTVDDARAFLRERGLSRAFWEVGPSSSPDDLSVELVSSGLALDDEVLKVLVLAREPEGVPDDDDVIVRRVETLEDFAAFYDVQQSAFETDAATAAEGREHLAEVFELGRNLSYIETYLAYLDDEPVATGRATFSSLAVALNGGSTLHRARGRGAYRAIVAARWRDACERGVPYLVTQARPSSFPILRRMGFEEVCEIRTFVDEGF